MTNNSDILSQGLVVRQRFPSGIIAEFVYCFCGRRTHFLLLDNEYWLGNRETEEKERC